MQTVLSEVFQAITFEAIISCNKLQIEHSKEMSFFKRSQNPVEIKSVLRNPIRDPQPQQTVSYNKVILFTDIPAKLFLLKDLQLKQLMLQ